jgi:hypothetical protein
MGAAVTLPQLSFAVERVEALRPAASPTLRFALRVDADGAAIRAVVLDVQLQIAAPRRPYSAAEQEGLADLFGAPHRWADTLRTVPWTRATLVVPPFDGSALAHLDIPCTYDFEVASARYLSSLRDGDVPLELLFSGSVFVLDGDGRLQVTRIAWDREATCSLPVRVWREAIEAHFPHTAWIRLQRDAFDRLAAFRARRSLTSWEGALEALLAAAAREDAGLDATGESARTGAAAAEEPPS